MSFAGSPTDVIINRKIERRWTTVNLNHTLKRPKGVTPRPCAVRCCLLVGELCELRAVADRKHQALSPTHSIADLCPPPRFARPERRPLLSKIPIKASIWRFSHPARTPLLADPAPPSSRRATGNPGQGGPRAEARRPDGTFRVAGAARPSCGGSSPRHNGDTLGRLRRTPAAAARPMGFSVS